MQEYSWQKRTASCSPPSWHARFLIRTLRGTGTKLIWPISRMRGFPWCLGAPTGRFPAIYEQERGGIIWKLAFLAKMRESQRLFLRSLMSKQFLSEKETRNMYRKACNAFGGESKRCSNSIVAESSHPQLAFSLLGDKVFSSFNVHRFVVVLRTIVEDIELPVINRLQKISCK